MDIKEIKSRIVELEKEAVQNLIKKFRINMIVESCLSQKKYKEYFRLKEILRKV